MFYINLVCDKGFHFIKIFCIIKNEIRIDVTHKYHSENDKDNK